MDYDIQANVRESLHSLLFMNDNFKQEKFLRKWDSGFNDYSELISLANDYSRMMQTSSGNIASANLQEYTLPNSDNIIGVHYLASHGNYVFDLHRIYSDDLEGRVPVSEIHAFEKRDFVGIPLITFADNESAMHNYSIAEIIDNLELMNKFYADHFLE